MHCSGKNSMVLEISATPYIFTFKLWDWGRLGLNGLPRPIHLDHGAANIQWDRTTEWVRRNLINRNVALAKGRAGGKNAPDCTSVNLSRPGGIGFAVPFRITPAVESMC